MIRKVFLHLSLALLFCAFAAGANAAEGLPDFVELAERAGPAVVNISTVKTVQGGPGQSLKDFFKRHPGQPFEDFFDRFDEFFRNLPEDEPRQRRSLGSGFVISKDGYIATNNHVISEADEIKVNLQDGEAYDAEIIGRDSETDLALLKIEADRVLPVLDFGDSDSLRVGEWVVAIGNPFGLDHTVTAGIVSAKGRVIGSGPYDDYIQTDASINPGNSGGPLLNLQGEVVGINTAIVATGQGIGFAVPSAMAEDIIAQLKSDREVQRGWLGVSIQNVDENTAKALDLEEPRGALISAVLPGQPAEEAGLEAGDVILAVGGQEVEDTSELLRKIAGLAPGHRARLTIWRDGGKRTVYVTLGKRDADKLAGNGEEPSESGAEVAGLGLSLRPMTAEEARALDVEHGNGLLVSEVEEGSIAEEGDLRQGDVILQVNQQDISSVQEFEAILEEEGREKGVLLLLVQRRGRSLFRTLRLDG
jgi:serine protease Do